ncbi:MAG: hypothetical protein ABI395_01860 [Sphingobium sp.]
MPKHVQRISAIPLTIAFSLHVHAIPRTLSTAGQFEQQYAIDFVDIEKKPRELGKPLNRLTAAAKRTHPPGDAQYGPVGIQMMTSRKWWFCVTRSAAYSKYVSTESAGNHHL